MYISAKDYPESACLPPVEAGDLVSHLVLQTSYITAKQFRAHKSLEAYNQSTSGWVKDVHVWNIADKYVVTGKVSALHSFDMNKFSIIMEMGYIIKWNINFTSWFLFNTGTPLTTLQ